ncbi:MAG TPA: CDGSH iron-sulfur domain-containing protein [Chthonomonadaceae bacterium]|nr:CDGSH iron-sulfur domain-containing protein [Chthonomonadaceae bacterium]
MPDTTQQCVTITITDDGPLEVVGPFTLMTESGEVVDLPVGEPAYLCRCGGSTTKPFCDGTHSEIGFQGAAKAVAAVNATATPRS